MPQAARDRPFSRVGPWHRTYCERCSVPLWSSTDGLTIRCTR
ncbi:hypothetical protein ACFPRL_03950 [Pseudoclavibacter helvolus]